ncbi:MAG: ribosome recycling factor [Candidatus Uhrbacteria bacterium]|nr:ribosome recycling factor [Candidatus Uhrbacteria bacterium]
MTIVLESKPQFQKVLEHLAEELSTIRTGRSTPALVENLNIEVYGANQPLKALASISTPDAKTVQIDPWDASVVKNIETAIQKSDLGMNPNVDGKTIRLIMPQMTDETRQKMVKIMKEKLENARVAIRQVREEVKKQIEKIESIGKDEKHDLLDSLDKLTKEMGVEIDAIGQKKEEQITTV